MKKFLNFIVIMLGIVCIVCTTLFFKERISPTTKVTITSASITERLTDISELATVKLEYHGTVRYEENGIRFLTAKNFTMLYDAQVKAGVNLQKAEIDINNNIVSIKIPKAEVLDISINPDTLQFYDESFALFNWTKKEDTVNALQLAQEDLKSKVGETDIIEEANQQAELIIEALLAPITEEQSYEIQCTLLE